MDNVVELEVTLKIRYTVSDGWYGVSTPAQVADEEKYHLLGLGANMVEEIAQVYDSVSLVNIEVVDSEDV